MTFFSNWIGIDEHLVLVDQLLRGEHGLLRVVAVVLDDQLELAPVHAALFVGLFDTQHHALAHGLAEGRNRPRQVLDGTDQDLVLADALRLRLGGTRSKAQGRSQDTE
jgi:hypothetical protein